MKLISIHLPSNKPYHFRRLVENLVSMAADPKCFEVVVKIDIGDDAMASATAAIQKEIDVNLKVVITPAPKSYFHTYIACNEALLTSDPDYYFCWHTNDEILIETRNWDQILARYVGFFPDHIFRLKVNPKKMFFNFFDIHEVCLYADYPIVPRKWLEATEVWAECHGPDTYQEGIAIYLGKYGYHRNVPLLNISIGGDEAGENLSEEKRMLRARGMCLAWDLSLTAKMQERFARAARRLQLGIVAHEMKLPNYELREDDRYKSITLFHDDRPVARVYYSIDYVSVAMDNFRYIATRRLDVWPYSLFGKPLLYRFAVYGFRIVRPIIAGIIGVIKIPIGLTFGFRLRALCASFVETQLGAHRYSIDAFKHLIKTRYLLTKGKCSRVLYFLLSHSPRLAAIYRTARSWYRARK